MEEFFTNDLYQAYNAQIASLLSRCPQVCRTEPVS